ncbi:Flagellar hook-associated protein FlgL [Salmonella enterica subsp. enterica serovar Johannesburg str. S5-703]|nr:Flagellar hook-associated protein FlgL [Salmonella enterica subsp. enterica serovar Johannesburg str. S5-703]
MRISTQMMYEQNMSGITNSQAEWMKLGEQMSTGKRVTNPSDDPIAASQAVVLSQAQAQNSQYALARTFATQKVSLEESVLSQVTTAIQTAQEKIVYAGNGTLSDDDRASLATDLQGIRDQLMNLANSTDGNGRYIFAGYKTEAAPFDQATGGYHGGEKSVTQQVDSARTMVIGHTGAQIFNSITSNAVPEPDGSDSEKNLFVMLDTAIAIAALKTPVEGAIAALKTPVEGNDVEKEKAAAAIDKTNRGLKNSLNNVLTVRAELGTQLSELSTLDSLGSDRALGQKLQMSNLVDVDWNSVISSYVMQQAALQASYKTFTDMQGMSLFQLNR